VWHQAGLVPQYPSQAASSNGPQDPKPHLVPHASADVPIEDATAHLEVFISCRQYVLPVVHDSTLRLLPTNKVQVLIFASSQPDGIETGEYLLFSCGRVDAIWCSLLPGRRRVTRLALEWKSRAGGFPSRTTSTAE
jgi:hypothetical protein